jgi:hypothetical protein
MNFVNKRTDATNEVGLEVNAVKSMYVLGSEVLTVASAKMAVFWVVVPWSVVVVYQRFWCTCCL